MWAIDIKVSHYYEQGLNVAVPERLVDPAC